MPSSKPRLKPPKSARKKSRAKLGKILSKGKRTGPRSSQQPFLQTGRDSLSSSTLWNVRLFRHHPPMRQPTQRARVMVRICREELAQLRSLPDPPLSLKQTNVLNSLSLIRG